MILRDKVIIILLECIVLVFANIVRMYNIYIVRVYFVQYILYWYELRTDVIDIIPVRTKDGWVYSYGLRTDSLLGIIPVRTKDGWIYLLHLPICCLHFCCVPLFFL